MMPCFAQCKKTHFITEISGTRLYFIINYKPKFGIFEQKESTWYIDLTSDFLFLHTFLLAVDKYLLTLKATSYFFICFYVLLISISQVICCLLFVGCFGNSAIVETTFPVGVVAVFRRMMCSSSTSCVCVPVHGHWLGWL